MQPKHVTMLLYPKHLTYFESILEILGEINHPVHVITFPFYILYHPLSSKRKQPHSENFSFFFSFFNQIIYFIYSLQV